MKKIFSLLTFLLLSNAAFSQMLLVGPTIHYNIGGGLKNISWGIECSYWQWDDLPLEYMLPVGLDIGFEFQKSKKRVYSEIQTGSVLGASCGYAYEWGENYHAGGIQASIWAAIFVGIELRYRRVDKSDIFAPGVFAKYPIWARYPPI